MLPSLLSLLRELVYRQMAHKGIQGCGERRQSLGFVYYLKSLTLYFDIDIGAWNWELELAFLIFVVCLHAEKKSSDRSILATKSKEKGIVCEAGRGQETKRKW